MQSIGHAKKPSQDWYADLNSALKEINDKIRPKRNRLIHDYWFESADKVLQVEMIAKVTKPQSRQTGAMYQRVTETSVGEILALQVMILASTAKIQNIISSRGHAPLRDKP